MPYIKHPYFSLPLGLMASEIILFAGQPLRLQLEVRANGANCGVLYWSGPVTVQ